MSRMSCTTRQSTQSNAHPAKHDVWEDHGRIDVKLEQQQRRADLLDNLNVDLNVYMLRKYM